VIDAEIRVFQQYRRIADVRQSHFESRETLPLGSVGYVANKLARATMSANFPRATCGIRMPSHSAKRYLTDYQAGSIFGAVLVFIAFAAALST
jgi:hypothetical protein